MKKFNWQIWAGFLLSVFAFLSYPLLFVRFAVTRDFPWANLLLFVVAIVLVLLGVRRAFGPDRLHPIRSKIAGSLLAMLSLVVLCGFIFTVFVWARLMPASHGAPQVGQQAPEFTLPDTTGRSVALAELLSAPLNGHAGAAGESSADRGASLPPKGVLLIFYRGYW